MNPCSIYIIAGESSGDAQASVLMEEIATLRQSGNCIQINGPEPLLHDSSHRYKYQYLEFRYFWKKLKPNGVLVSHDVNFNASFVDFVSTTYKHDKIGVVDKARTTHSLWARLGTIGFMVKSSIPPRIPA